MNVGVLLLAGILSFGVSQPAGEKVCLKNCNLSDNGFLFIRNFEGYYPYIYKDSAGLDTIGIGHLVKPGEKFKTPLKAEEARELFLKDASHAVRSVNKRVGVMLRTNQADSLISLTYNIGDGGLGQSSVLKYVNLEKHDQVPRYFVMWNKITMNGIKVPVRGLTRRREAEAELYRGK